MGDTSLHCHSGTWPTAMLLSSTLLPGAFWGLNTVFWKGREHEYLHVGGFYELDLKVVHINSIHIALDKLSHVATCNFTGG